MNTIDLDKLLTPDGAAVAIGVSHATVLKFVAQGRLTPIRLGNRCTRYDRDEVEALAAERNSK